MSPAWTATFLPLATVSRAEPVMAVTRGFCLRKTPSLRARSVVDLLAPSRGGSSVGGSPAVAAKAAFSAP